MTNQTLLRCFLLSWLVADAWAAPTPPPLLGCLIEAEQTTEIGSAVIGIIESIPVDRGDRVRRGQVVATLRDAVERAQIDVARNRAEIEADVGAAKASYELAQDKVRRTQQLRNQNFVSDQAVFQAEAEARVAQQKMIQAQGMWRVSKSEVGLAEARLSDRILRSPFDGVVTERAMSVGERVEMKGILRIAKLHPLRVEVVLPHTLYRQVSPNMLVSVEPEMPGMKPLQARVSRIDKVIDASSNTFRVRLELPNPDYSIPANLRCKADFGLTPPLAKEPAKSADVVKRPASFNADGFSLRLDQTLTLPKPQRVKTL